MSTKKIVLQVSPTIVVVNSLPDCWVWYSGATTLLPHYLNNITVDFKWPYFAFDQAILTRYSMYHK